MYAWQKPSPWRAGLTARVLSSGSDGHVSGKPPQQDRGPGEAGNLQLGAGGGPQSHRPPPEGQVPPDSGRGRGTGHRPRARGQTFRRRTNPPGPRPERNQPQGVTKSTGTAATNQRLGPAAPSQEPSALKGGTDKQAGGQRPSPSRPQGAPPEESAAHSPRLAQAGAGAELSPLCSLTGGLGTHGHLAPWGKGRRACPQSSS